VAGLKSPLDFLFVGLYNNGRLTKVKEMPEISSPLYILAEADTKAIRKETFMGQEHLVVPVVALVEGVVHPANSTKPELALASEFARHPDGWNGRPIVLDHPSVNGLKVSANQPKVLQEESFGNLFFSNLDGVKLKSEMWINLARVAELGDDVKDAVKGLEDGEITEISTALFSDVEMRKGTFKGQSFEGIWRNVTPDHLAILPEGVVGACSVEDGCGAPRLNQSACGPDCTCHEGSKGMPEPNPDKPAAGEPSITPNEEGGFRTFVQKFKGLISFRSEKEEVEVITNKEMSDRDTKTAIMVALSKEGEFVDPFIIALFSDSVVFEPDFSGKLLKRGFSTDNKGNVTLGAKSTEVRPVTEFVPASQHKEESTVMPDAKKLKVEALIANKRSNFTDEHSDWLLTLSEDQLGALEPQAEPDPPEKTAEELAAEKAATDEAAAAAAAAEGAKPPVEEPPQTAEQYLAKAPSEIREVLNEGVALRNQRRTELVEGLKANERCEYSGDELKSMSVVDLERMAKLANIPSFEGRGGGLRTHMGDDDPNSVPEPEDIWSPPERKSA